MNSNPTEIQPAPTLGLNDLAYLFFRHKWKIIFFSIAGIAVGVTLYLTDKTAYRAQAKVLVRYITERRDIRESGPGEAEQIRTPLDPRESSIMSAEVEILRSTDGILSAVKEISPAKVLKAYGSGTNLYDGVQLVMDNLHIDLSKGSGVMVLTLSHRDQDVAVQLLAEIIKQYRINHDLAHKGTSLTELNKQIDDFKRELQNTEEALQKEKKAVNISSLDQSKMEFGAQINDLKRLIFQTSAELAQARAQLEERRGSAPVRDTNAVDQASNSKPAEQLTAAQVAQFNSLSRRLAGLRADETELLRTFSESSKRVQQIRQDIQEAEQKLKDLHIDPALLEAAAPAAPGSPTFDWLSARAGIAALEAKYQTLTNSLAKVQEEAARVDARELAIVQLERNRKFQEDRLSYYVKSAEEQRLNENIKVEQRNNIQVIQVPSRIPPDLNKILKKAGAAAGGGIGFGFLLAFLIDYVFNRSVKRAKEVETGLKLPVLASIPDFGGKLKLSKAQKKSLAVERNGANGHFNGEVVPWEESDPMLPYYEALRDRVVMSYNGDLHKPKIVGLTSCHRGAGVSRLATGLAASLSRDLPRNVLLVALERNKVAVSSFAKGRPMEGLDAPEDNDSAEKALVVQNLHSLATTGKNLAGASVVQSFSDLMPKLKISDYDYIIFDLPPLSQTSGSLRLASQMERTVLVVEAEETPKDKVKRVKSLLKTSHANLFTVVNKARHYGPKSLEEDI